MHYVLWEQSSSHVASFARSDSLSNVDIIENFHTGTVHLKINNIMKKVNFFWHSLSIWDTPKSLWWYIVISNTALVPVYPHYRSPQMSFIGTWGGGSDKMRSRIGFWRCQIQIRLIPAQIKGESHFSVLPLPLRLIPSPCPSKPSGKR